MCDVGLLCSQGEREGTDAKAGKEEEGARGSAQSQRRLVPSHQCSHTYHYALNAMYVGLISVVSCVVTEWSVFELLLFDVVK